MDDSESHYQPLRGELMNQRSTINSRHVNSILKDSNKQSLSQRKDYFGEDITQRGKHRIKFKKEIYVVIEVENWKNYNVDVSQERGCVQCQLL